MNGFLYTVLCVYLQYYVWVCFHVWPHSSRRTTCPQRDGVRQLMNEPTKVVSSSLLHSSFWNHHVSHLNGWRCSQSVAVLNRDYTVHILLICVYLCVVVPVWVLSLCVCVRAVRRIVAPLAADATLCFKSRLPTQCRATITAKITSLIHTAPLLTSYRCSISGCWQFGFLFTSSTGKKHRSQG